MWENKENQTEVENPPTPEYVAQLKADAEKWRSAFLSEQDRNTRINTLNATRANKVELEIRERWDNLDEDGKEFAKQIADHLDISLTKIAKVEATVTFTMDIEVPIDTDFDDIDFSDFDFEVSESNYEFSVTDYNVDHGDMSVEQQ